MTTDEKLAEIAKAILWLSRESAHAWDYDGEQMIASGVSLPNESKLREIAEEPDATL